MNEQQAARYIAAQEYMAPYWPWHRSVSHNLEVAIEAMTIERYAVALEKVDSCILHTKKLIAAIS